MSATRPGAILRHLHPADPDDGPLLARFAGRRDPAAFAALVRRHGPMVLAVCRRITGHPQDAEDAFQAAFLVLARSAGTVRTPERLGSWLYGVAVRVAGRARRAAARRRRREVTVAAFPDVPAPDPAPPPPDIGPALHEELAALPALHREPIVLCDLQGLSRADAARSLGIAEGTLSSRLANGRKRLADRLTRRGVALSLAALPAAVAGGRAAVPDELVSNTCGLAAAWAAGAPLPAAVVRLARGGFPMRGVLLGGVLSFTLAAGAVLAAGLPGAPRPADPPRPPEPPVAVAQDAEEQQPKKADAPPKRTGAPRLTRKVDLNFKTIQSATWSPDGAWLVVQGAVAGNADGVAVMGPRPGGGVNEFVLVPFDEPEILSEPQPLPIRAGVVGFTGDGRLLTVAREPGLISGGSTLQQWQLSVLRNGPDATAPRTLRVVPVAPVAVPDDGYLLTPTGTGVRYVVRESDKAGIRRVEVRQYNLRNNEDVVLGRFEGTFKATQFAPDAKRVAAVTDAGAVELYDAADGRRLWAADPAAKAREIRVVNEGRGGKGGFPFAGFTIPGVGSGTYPAVPAFVAFAGRAPRLLAVRGWVAPVVLDADTGKALPALEGVELAATSSRVAAVSGDYIYFPA
ncbi:RNA polymerase sigma factor, partial [bacterium]|nr:RNA polymerase sigma factor [bacterium]